MDTHAIFVFRRDPGDDMLAPYIRVVTRSGDTVAVDLDPIDWTEYMALREDRRAWTNRVGRTRRALLRGMNDAGA